MWRSPKNDGDREEEHEVGQRIQERLVLQEPRQLLGGQRQIAPRQDTHDHRCDAAHDDEVHEGLHAGGHIQPVLDEESARDEHRAVDEVADTDAEEDEEEPRKQGCGVDPPVARPSIQVGDDLEGLHEATVDELDRYLLAPYRLLEGQVHVDRKPREGVPEFFLAVGLDPSGQHEGAIGRCELSAHLDVVSCREQ